MVGVDPWADEMVEPILVFVVCQMTPGNPPVANPEWLLWAGRGCFVKCGCCQDMVLTTRVWDMVPFAVRPLGGNLMGASSATYQT